MFDSLRLIILYFIKVYQLNTMLAEEVLVLGKVANLPL